MEQVKNFEEAHQLCESCPHIQPPAGNVPVKRCGICGCALGSRTTCPDGRWTIITPLAELAAGGGK